MSISAAAVPVITIAEDEDFKRLKNMVDNDEEWVMEYDKSGVRVWSQQDYAVTSASSKMIKVICHFPAVNSIDLYDVIHDPDYRKIWDNSMVESVDIGHLNPNNDVCYYAVSCPPPMKNRDFVLQRSWLDTGNEQFIINHSVLHKDYPPRNDRVRAHSLFTGYLIRQSAEGGCCLGYVTQSDLQGDLPSWLVNKGTKILAPKYVRQLEKAALGYRSWKSRNNPNSKPWHYPEQIISPKLPLQQSVVISEPRPSSGIPPNVNPPAYDNPASLNPAPLTFAQRCAKSLKGSQLPTSRPRKKPLMSCFNFTKNCVGRNSSETLP